MRTDEKTFEISEINILEKAKEMKVEHEEEVWVGERSNILKQKWKQKIPIKLTIVWKTAIELVVVADL